MPFHVEISAGFHRARVFNLSREDLTTKVLEPWLGDRKIPMGDREWEPRKSSMKILEGPQMAPQELSFGQGWSNAERVSENVTHSVLAQTPPPSLPDAFLVEAESPEAVVAELVAGHGGRAIQWTEAQSRLDGRDPKIAAVILLVRRPEPGPERN
ncbi:MAG: hypothetical protein WB507_10340 [Solirubrobacterales bacterium]